MKIKIVLISVTAVLVLGLAFMFWRLAHAPKEKVVIEKKRVVAREAVKKRKLPAVEKKYSNPKIVIVIDDFGYNMSNLDQLFAAKGIVTFSVLPNLPYSNRVALLARSKGYEVILHLPLEAIDKTAPTEVGTIKTDMNEKDIIAMLDKDIKSVPGLCGVSNHQGSKATEDKRTMAIIMAQLKKRNLYFFDSLVIGKSVCREVAASSGVPYAKRDMFLDNKNSADYIEKQIFSLRKLAFKNGGAIGICHDRKNTIAVLNKMMPELSAEGVQFARLSDMVK